MTKLYNQQTAEHYAAYRPPLHSMILRKVLNGNSKFKKGLDIGCGTGDSTIALSDFCDHVVGIDPSQSMLDRANQHSNITYMKESGEDIPLPDGSVDIITLAGSLFYMDVNKVAAEIKRVCGKGAVVIPYDFKILFDDILASLSIPANENDSEYNHALNFSGQSHFEEITVKEEQIHLELLGDQLAHLLLSEHHLYEKFCDKYSTKNPFEKLKSSLIKSGNHFFIKTDLFYSKYRLANT